MRVTRWSTLLVLLLASLLPPRRAAAQEILPALVGGAAGLLGGGLVSIGIVTAQARRGNYLYSTSDALGWHATPILIGSGAGFTVGLLSQDRLRNTVMGGAAVGVVGMGVGSLLGYLYWAPPEGKWAGGVIGGAAGLLLGSTIGVLLPTKNGDETQGSSARFPVGVRIPF